MPSKREQKPDPEVFQQRPDPRGRIRLDRPFTPEEAEAQDREHREQYLAERSNRFRAPAAGA
jgi:hypothetical protein